MCCKAHSQLCSSCHISLRMWFYWMWVRCALERVARAFYKMFCTFFQALSPLWRAQRLCPPRTEMYTVVVLNRVTDLSCPWNWESGPCFQTGNTVLRNRASANETLSSISWYVRHRTKVLGDVKLAWCKKKKKEKKAFWGQISLGNKVKSLSFL